MLITFLVRSRQFNTQKAYLRFYTDIDGAFDMAYIIDNHPGTIEFKCLFDETIVDQIPGTGYKPKRLVRDFNYMVE